MDTKIEVGASVTKVPRVQQLRFTDLPDPISKQFDKNGFANILRDMKGSRSVREFALDTDLSDSFISKAVNGYIDRAPSKRTMLKLLQVKRDTSMCRELMRVAGYPDSEIDWDDDEEQRPISAAEIIFQFYGGNHFEACGLLMKTLSQHGVKGDMSSYYHRKEGYFEIRDEQTGQEYVGIDVYTNPEADKENAVISQVFSLAITFNKIAMSKGVKDKVVVIMTNDERIFEGCKTLDFDKAPKATVVVQMDYQKGCQREFVLNGKSPVSLLG